MDETTSPQEEVLTLESEIRGFCSDLPYWKKYLADVILQGNEIEEQHAEQSLKFLKEDLELLEMSEARPNLTLDDINITVGDYKDDLVFDKLSNVEGVNALAEGQTIEFHKNLTILYGVNGSGKSSYSRLLKNVFYSKTHSDILPNIYEEESKPVYAKLSFKEGEDSVDIDYTKGTHDKRFEQLAVFDTNSVVEQLQRKHGFNFRPASLSFFSLFIEGVGKVEQLFNFEVSQKKQVTPILEDLLAPMEGKSKIKEELARIHYEIDFDTIKRFAQFKEENNGVLEALEKEEAELKVQTASKEKSIKENEKLIEQLGKLISSYKNLNEFTSDKTIREYNDLTFDFIQKNDVAQQKGVSQFSNTAIKAVGSSEWKDFIKAADLFAKTQKKNYPEEEDSCLLCHQPLGEEANKLVEKYWDFLKSKAEEDAEKAQQELKKVIDKIESRNTNLFPDENLVSVWLKEHKSSWIERHQRDLKILKGVLDDIKYCLINKEKISIDEFQLDVESIEILVIELETRNVDLLNDEQSKKLEELHDNIQTFKHQQVFNRTEVLFKTHLENTGWLARANKASFNSRSISLKEKDLSQKYFNDDYLRCFNEECDALKGNFGVTINHSTTSGESKRELKLEGKSPNVVLSEGEQKVIGLADFLAEMRLSAINRGIIFDDPVTSLDDTRKRVIAKRLVELAKEKQVIVFTHDLVFTSELFDECDSLDVEKVTHWVERGQNISGLIRPENTPAIDAEYKNSTIARKLLDLAKGATGQPEFREMYLKYGFSALRTSYETLVIYDLFQSSVLRFKDRVSVDAIKNIPFCIELRDEIMDNFGFLCRHMEGHSHSAEFCFIPPSVENLESEIAKYNRLRKDIRGTAERIKQNKLELGQVHRT